MTGKQAKTAKTKTSEKVRKSSKTYEESAHVLEVSGLCLSCDYVETCMHRKRSNETVHFCEEFTETLNAPIHKFRQVPPQLPPKEEIALNTGLKGLCVNCDHRASCSHALREGGVWQCEEYS